MYFAMVELTTTTKNESFCNTCFIKTFVYKGKSMNLHYNSYNLKEKSVFLLFIICFLISVTPQLLFADIVTDGTTGQAQSLSGPNYIISDTLGTTTGTNLFHSFQDFSISQNQSATFTGPNNIANVFSRVTGGNISNIDGTLRSEIGQANFFFINPRGVIFGENAVVNVPAAFHVSTADELRFDDGSIFSASSPNNSTLTMATPESFGFLGGQAATIEVNGTLLEFKPENKISISSRDITIQGTETQNADIASAGGEINLTAMGSEIGDVFFDKNRLSSPSNGVIKLIKSRISTSNNPAGTIFINTKDLNIDKAGIRSTATDGNGNGGGVIINASGTIIMNNDSDITANNLGKKDGPNIKITAGNLDVKNGSDIISLNSSTGKGGDISIFTNNDITIKGGEDTLIISQIGKGQGGNIDINTNGTLKMEGGSSICIASQDSDSGIGGNLNIQANQIELYNGSEFFANCNRLTTGKVGDISLNADQSILFNGYDSSTTIPSGIRSQLLGNGSVGQIKIQTPVFMLKDGGKIQTQNFSSVPNSRGASINIDVNDLTILSNKKTMSGSSELVASSLSAGNSGAISITAQNKIIINGNDNLFGAAVRNSSSSGVGADINIKTKDLMILNNGIIHSTTKSGMPGNIITDVERLNFQGGHISNGISPAGTGTAKMLSIDASDYINIEGNYESTLFLSKISQIDSLTFSESQAGIITINTPSLRMGKGGRILTSTYGPGKGGTININSSQIIMNDKASILSIATTHSQGNAGNIRITDNASLKLTNGSYISSSTKGKGNAGKVFIDSNKLHIKDESTGIYCSANDESTGYVGDITIKADSVNLENNATIGITADQTLSNDRLIGMPKNSINITTNHLHLDQNSQITTKSSSNVPAGDVNIQADNTIVENSSSITTSANNADAGSINIQMDNLFLHNGVITTSVDGKTGKGGDITITGINNNNKIITNSDYLILKGGFIQANTGGEQPGDININTDAIIVNPIGTLQVGAKERQVFQADSNINIIQAATPGGEQGDINITSPEIDISNFIVYVDNNLKEQISLATDPCVTFTKKDASSLVQGSKGGIPEGANSLLTVSFTEKRLNWLLKNEEK